MHTTINAVGKGRALPTGNQMTETYAVSVGPAVGMPPPRPSGLQTMLFLHQQVGRVNVHGSQMVYTTRMTATVQHTTLTASSAVGEAEQTRRRTASATGAQQNSHSVTVVFSSCMGLIMWPRPCQHWGLLVLQWAGVSDSFISSSSSALFKQCMYSTPHFTKQCYVSTAMGFELCGEST